MDKVRVSAKTYDEAVTKALIDLGTTADNTKINIIESGTKGFFGLGAKPFTIEVEIIKKSSDFEDIKKDSILNSEHIKREFDKVASTISLKENSVSQAREVRRDEIRQRNERKFESSTNRNVDRSFNRNADRFANQDKEQNVFKKSDFSNLTSVNKENIPAKQVNYSENEINEIKNNAGKFLSDIFRTMDLDISFEYIFNSEYNELSILMLSEEDMGILIGKRGQTLDAIQYLLSLVINKNSREYIRVKLDAENYRSKRKEKLESLARSIAQKVKRTRRPVSLEPMNPYERRIIHSALQADNAVTTRSEGDEPFRHVTVILKNNYQRNRNNRRPRYRKNFQDSLSSRSIEN